MANTYNFAKQFGLGKWGEKQVIRHLELNPAIDSVRDVTQDNEWQKKGVDVIYVLADGQGTEVTADIKMDMLMHRTGNAFIETMSNNESGKKGNLLTSAADFFIYYDPFGKMLYMFPVGSLRNFLENNEEDLRQKGYFKKVKNKTFTSEGFAIDPDLLCVHIGGRKEKLAIPEEV